MSCDACRPSGSSSFHCACSPATRGRPRDREAGPPPWPRWAHTVGCAAASAAIALGLVACGGDAADLMGPDEVSGGTVAADTSGEPDAGGDAPDSADQPVSPAAPGQATVAVDGQEWTLTEPGAIGCSIAEDMVSFSFVMGDNEVTLGGGANRSDGAWLGSIDLRVLGADTDLGPAAYYPDLAANGDAVTIDGERLTYAGPMLRQPPNDGSNPPPEDAGSGTISVTCG